MIACLRLFTALCFAALLAACASSPSSSLGELPRTPDASIEQLLDKAATSKSAEDAALLRLSAADLAYKQKDYPRAARILEQVPMDSLKPAQQVFASTLAAELAMSRNQPKAALSALSHPSLQRRTNCQRTSRHVPTASTPPPGGRRPDPGRRPAACPACPAAQRQGRCRERRRHLGPRRLAAGRAIATACQQRNPRRLDEPGAGRQACWHPEQQQAAIDTWRDQHPDHPAAKQLPQALVKLKELASQPLTKIALLLPQEGPLAGVARALRDGFMAAHFQAQQSGQPAPAVQVFDSSRMTSLDEFYRQAQAAGVQLVVGPLENPW